MSLTHLSHTARMRTLQWQQWLRHSARLYLSRREPDGPAAAQLRRGLRAVEQRMLQCLLAGAAATVAAIEQAWSLIQAAQARLLVDPRQVAAVRAEASAAQALAAALG